MRKRKKERQLDRRLFPDALAGFQILKSLVRAIRSSPNPPFCSLNKYYLTKQVEMEQLFDELFVLICLISTQMLSLVQKENIHFQDSISSAPTLYSCVVLWVKNSPILCEAISVPVRLYSTEKWPRWTSFTSLSRAQDSLIARYLRGKRYSLERICIIWCIQVFVLNNRSWVTMKTSARKKKEKVVLLPPKTLFCRV